MNLSNFPYPAAGRYVVQGTDAGTWLDSKWSAETPIDAQRIADERKREQRGEWRVVLNKSHANADAITRAIAAIGTIRTAPRYFAESDGGYCGSEADCPRTFYVCHTHGRERIDCASMKEARELAAKLNAESR
jgi:hypothetical protein